MKLNFTIFFTVLLFITVMIQDVKGQPFTHPGSLHTQADFDRIKTQIAAGAHPWIDAWNTLIQNPRAQNTNVAHPQPDFGTNRQQAAIDAEIAYYNTVRWYISGDTTYAACAKRILNSWSSHVTVFVPTDPLGILPINDFAIVGEMLRTYPGWAPADFARFQTMMSNHYAWAHQFLRTHNNQVDCPSQYPTSWEGTFVSAIIGIGVLCDNRTIYNDGVDYFKNGDGSGSVMNAVWTLQGPLGQTSESGRDQSHSQLGMANLAIACQVAWNQGDDLFGFSNNRLLAGFEYEAQYNLGHTVPYTAWNNCVGDNEMYIAPSQRGHNGWPNYELVYNHYAVLKGLSAPNTKAMAELTRPEIGTDDLFGQGTLLYTLNASTFPPVPVPPIPSGFVATPGVSEITLDWTLPPGDIVQGYNIFRSATSGGPYTKISSSTQWVIPEYVDSALTNGTTYYYQISAINQAGTSGNSVQVSAKPLAAGTTLPAGWARKDIGTVAVPGSAFYANVENRTFIVRGSGKDIGGTADSYSYLYSTATGDATITARLLGGWNGVTGAEKVGIVMRESLDANAKMLTVNLGELGNRYARFGTRSATGGGTTWQEGNHFSQVPLWLRLQRSGNTFTAFQSPDGISWYVMGTSTFTMASACYIGLSACAGSSSGTTVSSPTFDHVTIIGGGSVPSAPATLTGSALSSSRIKLTWPLSTGAASYLIERSPSGSGPYTIIAPSITDTAFTDSELVANTNYYYSVRAANIVGLSADSVKATVKTNALALPLAPTGLNLAAGNAHVALTWVATDESPSSYSIKRATVTAGPYTAINTSTATSYTDNTASNGSTYYYKVSAVNAVGEGPASAPVSIYLGAKLTGTLIGTSGSWNGDPTTTKAAAVDSNLNTYFDANQTDGAWVGIDLGLGNSAALTRLSFAPRANIPQRMVGGVFQGANTSDFSDLITLYTVSATPPAGVLTDQIITNTQSFRYFRYLSPNGSSGDVAEIEFWGKLNTNTSTVPPAQITGLTVNPGDGQISLSWIPATGAAGYKISRANVSGGPYTDVVTLSATNYIDLHLTTGLTYFYTVTGVNTIGQGPASTPVGVFLPKKLTGLLVGTSGSWNSDPSTTKAAAMDGNLNTYFDANQTDGAWVGLDLGTDTSAMVTMISFAPRSNIPQRMIGGVFQGANMPDFSDAVLLYTVTSAPVAGVLTFQNISSTSYYRYLRYLSPNASSGNVAEVNFYGQIQTGRNIPAVPTGLVAGLGDTRVILNWSPTADATSYNVKRASASGGPYTTILAIDISTTYTDLTVNIGSTYFYKITAINRKGEGPESAPANIFVARKLTGTIVGTAGSWNNDPTTTKAAAMDGNLNTFFDANQTDGAWVGLDLGPDIAGLVTQISFAPRSNIPQRMIGGIFQGANAPDFSDAVALYTVTASPSPGMLTSQPVSNISYFRYLRYLSPNGGSGDVAEVNFFGQVKHNQTITFNPIGKKLMGDADFSPGASADSDLPINYSSADTAVAIIVNGKIHLVGPGMTTIIASQMGDSSYNAAAAISQTLRVDALNLQVQYQDGDNGQLNNNIIRPYLKIVNADSVGVAYSELTMRYWFTAENYTGINTWIDYAQLGNNNVKMKYVQSDLPRNGALGYIEYSFISPGNLEPNSNTGLIQSRFANQDWSNLSESDDYSLQSNTISYVVNNHVTLYRNGVLIFGAEPAVVPATTSLSISYQNQNQNTAGNSISTFLAINNNGNVPLSLGDLTARYWFTEEGTQGLNYWIDYAKIGNNNVNGKFVKLSPALNGADAYFEIAINSSVGAFYPLSSTGNIQYRITKTDWSNFNELNDYSYQPKDVMKENNHITIYYKGQLIYGTEPGAIVMNALAQIGSPKTVSDPAAPNQVLPLQSAIQSNIIYPNPAIDKRFSVKLTADLVNKQITVKIRDSFGRVIQNGVFQGGDETLQVPLINTYLPGVYFVQLNNLVPIRLLINK
jgi:fibronectin type 3 domain-containing protein